MAIKLIVGLGNPGPEYEQTRHNAGAWLVHQLAAEKNETLLAKSKFHGLIGKITVAGKQCRLLIPTTYMNLSGQAVCTIAKFYEITPEEILIAHDEIDMSPGTVRLKASGGHGGHNGLRDIFKSLNSQNFYRLRIGVGKPKNKDNVVDYVLKRPSKTEQKLIDDAINNASRILPEIISGNIQKAMKELHTAKIN